MSNSPIVMVLVFGGFRGQIYPRTGWSLLQKTFVVGIQIDVLARIGVGTEFKQLHFRKAKAKSHNVVDALNCFIEARPVIQSDLLSVREILDSGGRI